MSIFSWLPLTGFDSRCKTHFADSWVLIGRSLGTSSNRPHVAHETNADTELSLTVFPLAALDNRNINLFCYFAAPAALILIEPTFPLLLCCNRLRNLKTQVYPGVPDPVKTFSLLRPQKPGVWKTSTTKRRLHSSGETTTHLPNRTSDHHLPGTTAGAWGAEEVIKEHIHPGGRGSVPDLSINESAQPTTYTQAHSVAEHTKTTHTHRNPGSSEYILY